MTDNELLLAISEIMDKKLKPINDRVAKIELTQETKILPRLHEIESCSGQRAPFGLFLRKYPSKIGVQGMLRIFDRCYRRKRQANSNTLNERAQ